MRAPRERETGGKRAGFMRSLGGAPIAAAGHREVGVQLTVWLPGG